MIDGLTKLDTGTNSIIVDLRYIQENNVCKKRISNITGPYLTTAAATALYTVIERLKLSQLTLVVWDAYRTEETQKQLRDFCDDERYVARDSNHSRGTAVDLTLADDAGNYLDMGTDFDEFSERAHVDCSTLTDTQANNRKTLKSVLESFGFKQLSSEWWHFDFEGTV